MAVSFATDYLAFLIEVCMVESSLIAMERCKEFYEIAPEDGYSSFVSDQKLFQLPKPAKVQSMLQ